MNAPNICFPAMRRPGIPEQTHMATEPVESAGRGRARPSSPIGTTHMEFFSNESDRPYAIYFPGMPGADR